MKMKKAWVIFLAIIIPALLLVTGCDSRTGNAVYYEITSINIAPRELYADNDNETNSLVTVTVEDNEGYPAEGVAVELTTDIGYLLGKVYTTDAGVATATYYDNGIVGIAHITASINESTVADTINVKSIPYNEITSINVTPKVLLADNDNETNSLITVTVENSEGYPAEGVAVDFTTDLGHLLSKVFTTDAGVATNTFNDNGISGIAHITATINQSTVGDSIIPSSVTETINVQPLPYRVITSMNITPRLLYADSDEETNSVITVTVEDSEGNSVADVGVHFTTDFGYLPSIVYTDNAGIATTTYNDNGIVGIAHITASIDESSVTDNITVAPIPYCVITSMNITPRLLYADDDDETFSVITVTVEDSEGNPAAGVDVHFTTDFGYLPSIKTTNAAGIATTNYHDIGTTGVAHITVSIDESIFTDYISVEPIPNCVITSINITPRMLYADDDDETYSEISVTVEDNEGNPAALVSVYFTTDIGHLTSTVRTTAAGVAKNTYYDDGNVGIAHITATIDESTVADNITVQPIPYCIITSMNITPRMLYADDDDETFSVITVTVEDSEENPAAGVGVSLTTDFGYLPSKIYTNAAGVATVNYNDTGTTGIAHITATIDESIFEGDITVEPMPYNVITSMNITPRLLYADDDEETFSVITVTVEDSEGNSAAGVGVSLTASIGYLPSKIYTNNAGIATTNYHDNGNVCIAHITASIDESVFEGDITVNPVPYNVITSMNINPRLLYADNENNTNSTITVTVEDYNGSPAASVPVDFTTSIGHLTSRVFTNGDGVAENTYQDNGIVGVAFITATVDETTVADSITVQSIPYFLIDYVRDVSNMVNYADGGITYSTIEVKIVDEEGFGATGKAVRFQATLGNILAQVSTDSSGIARTNFWDLGVAGLAVISVFVGTDDQSTIEVTIEEPLPVTGLDLDITNYTMNVNTVKTIKATATNVLGNVPDGTPITFNTENGFFQVSGTDNTYVGETQTLTTINGIARAFFNSGLVAGESLISATTESVGGIPIVVEETLTILPGRPTVMTLKSRNEMGEEQTEIAVGSGESLNVWATIEDSYGNYITPANRTVILETDIGTIESPVSVTEMMYTDDIPPVPLGNAMATFSAGVNAGVAQITASVDSAFASTTITVNSDEINSIRFINQSQLSIDVQGTGGDETAEIAVNLFDMNGNLIDDPIWVYFKFQQRPENNTPAGSNINNVVYNLTDYDSTMSSNGMAVISINSGITSGIVAIRSWCKIGPDPDDEVSATKSNIVIQSGPPAQCEFTIGGFDSGDDMGSGLWEVEVAALITDINGNPVSNGTAVYFYLDPNPEYPTDYASIVAYDAFVGNENAAGDTLGGTAFTSIIYDGSYTNETIKVFVDVGGEVTFDGDLMLPLQAGEITMICVPIFVAWGTNFENSLNDLFTQCRVSVRDGQNNPVNKQRIIFTSTRGRPTDEGEHGIHPIESDIDPYWLQLYDFTDLNEETPTDEHDGYTGPYDGEHGRLYKDVGFHREECPPPVPAPPGTTTALITATIFGTVKNAQQTITLYRYAGAEDE